MRFVINNVAIALASVSVLACSAPGTLSSGFMPTHPAQAPIAVGEVELVFAGHAAKPYSELGVAQATLTGARFVRWTENSKPPPGPGYSDMLNELRAIGARNGCNAMLVQPTTYVITTMLVTAICIAYKPEATTALGT